MTAATIEVPCGCVFEADGEMRMVSYCSMCAAALKDSATIACPNCNYRCKTAEELDAVCACLGSHCQH